MNFSGNGVLKPTYCHTLTLISPLLMPMLRTDVGRLSALTLTRQTDE